MVPVFGGLVTTKHKDHTWHFNLRKVNMNYILSTWWSDTATSLSNIHRHTHVHTHTHNICIHTHWVTYPAESLKKNGFHLYNALTGRQGLNTVTWQEVQSLNFSSRKTCNSFNLIDCFLFPAISRERGNRTK